MEIPTQARDNINTYIRDTFIDIPPIVEEFTERARALPIPPHHIMPEFGKLLSILVQAKPAKSILEIGTMWGYSTWWLCQGLPENGTVITLEKELKHYNLAKEFFATANLPQVEVRHCDALTELSSFQSNQFDFIFLDADKREYTQLFDGIISLLQPGGIFVADNVIFSSAWKGQTVAEATTDERIQTVQKFNRILARHPDFTAVPVAINSGIMVAVKH